MTVSHVLFQHFCCCTGVLENGQLTSMIEDHVKSFTDKVNNTFRTGYGTVLFFENHKVIKGWGEKMPNYAKVRSKSSTEQTTRS